MEDLLADSMTRRKVVLSLMGAFGVVALLLAAIGTYGVMSVAANQRVREIGIRMALGASRGAVLKMVLRQGLTLVFIGLAAGTVGALFLVRLMKEVLYGVSPTDPITFLVVSATLLIVAAVACLMPARRATMVNPIAALRAN